MKQAVPRRPCRAIAVHGLLHTAGVVKHLHENDLAVGDDDFLRVEATDCPMSSCAASAGSPCRTGKGWVAASAALPGSGSCPTWQGPQRPVSALRKPGSAWAELPRPAAPGTVPAGYVRIGYARASTVRQSLDTQVDSLKAAGVTQIFAEKISTRAVTCPELDRGVALARDLRVSRPRVGARPRQDHRGRRRHRRRHGRRGRAPARSGPAAGIGTGSSTGYPAPRAPGAP
jgi:hypothetical protein